MSFLLSVNDGWIAGLLDGWKVGGYIAGLPVLRRAPSKAIK